MLTHTRTVITDSYTHVQLLRTLTHTYSYYGLTHTRTVITDSHTHTYSYYGLTHTHTHVQLLRTHTHTYSYCTHTHTYSYYAHTHSHTYSYYARTHTHTAIAHTHTYSYYGHTHTYSYYGLLLWFPEYFKCVYQQENHCVFDTGDEPHRCAPPNVSIVCNSTGSSLYLDSLYTALATLPATVLGIVTVNILGGKLMLGT